VFKYLPRIPNKTFLGRKPGVIKRKIIFDLKICLIELATNKWRKFLSIENGREI